MEFSIFLVDDDEDGRSTLSLIFSRIGLSECITFFRDGNTLRKRLEQLPVSAYPELIAVDYRVQGNSGDEILTLLKTDSRWSSIPVALYGNRMTALLRQKLMNLGAVACFEKSQFYVEYTELARQLVELTSPMHY